LAGIKDISLKFEYRTFLKTIIIKIQIMTAKEYFIQLWTVKEEIENLGIKQPIKILKQKGIIAKNKNCNALFQGRVRSDEFLEQLKQLL
jgi:hypothetical protein